MNILIGRRKKSATRIKTANHHLDNQNYAKLGKTKKLGSKPDLSTDEEKAFLMSSSPSNKMQEQQNQHTDQNMTPITSKFLIASVLVSLSLHKLAHLIFDPESHFHLLSIKTVLSLPGVFLYDGIFFYIFLYTMKQCRMLQKQPIQHKETKIEVIARTALLTSGIVLFAISAFETFNLFSRRENVPWDMLIDILQHLDDFRGMIAAQVEIESVFLVIFLYIFTTLLALLVSERITQLDIVTTSTKTKNKRCIILLLTTYWCTLHPSFEFWHTPMISVPIDIIGGIRIDTVFPPKFSCGNYDLSEEHSGEDGAASFQVGKPLNVVLILLESMRGDFFPFDGTTEWAKRFIPDATTRNLAEEITPFYSKWVQQSNTFYVPHIKTAAGFTHKSLVNIFCSLHALPVKMTQEHTSRLYHKCLPDLLSSTGSYKNHRHFKPLTSDFNFQTELMANIGYTIDANSEDESDIEFYGEREFNQEHNWPASERKKYTANYLGYEDNVLVEPIAEWLDNRLKQKQEPFLMSYLSGVTHDPYDYPPENFWERKEFSKDKKVDGLLNAVAYTDVFLEKLVSMFKERNLMDSTLFVVMGDHGVNAKNRGYRIATYQQNYEESFNVGVSFHTENKQVAEQLKKLDRNALIQNAVWSSIDVVPTILDLLQFHDGKDAKGKDGLNGKNYNETITDGRSMLHPSGQRLSFSIPNPGDTVVFRDGAFLIIVPNKGTPIKLFDLERDPYQLSPIILNNKDIYPEGNMELYDWGKNALKFVRKVNNDLMEAHCSGRRCTDCALSKLLSLETLSQWDEYY